MHGLAVWQPVPSYPSSHDVHVHDPVVPPTVPPLMQWKVPSDPSLFASAEAVHAVAVWQLVPSYPSSHDVQVQAPVVPPIVPPLMQ